MPETLTISDGKKKKRKMVPKDFIHTDNLYPVFPKRPRLEIFTAKYVKQRKTNLQRKQSL